MRYISEKMKEILSSSTAQRMMDYVSPVYEDAYTALHLFNSIGLELDDIVQWCAEYVEQVVPQTATWALPYYEQEYGLPSNTEDITKRRETLLVKIRTRAPVTPYKLMQVVKGVSCFDCRIEENSAPNCFTIVMQALPGKFDENQVIKAVSNIKPAHLTFTISYEQGVETNVYAGGILFVGKIITIRQGD